MNLVNFNERSCERFRRYFDGYLDNELLVETNQEVIQHLTSCAECTSVLEGRARVKKLVRNAVLAEHAPEELAAALRHRFPPARQGFFGHEAVRWGMAAAAAVLLAIGGVAALQWGHIIDVQQGDGVLQTVSARVQKILHVGLMDHIHCTIALGRWKKPVSFDEMKSATGRQALGPDFIGLVPAVKAKLGSSFKLVQGHRCVTEGRQYVHLILTGAGDTVLSVVITEKRNESFTEADAKVVIRAAGVPIYANRQEELEIAGFESEKYLAYVVSNLDRHSNLNVAALVGPLVHDHLTRLEL
jgi:hypothetical protein